MLLLVEVVLVLDDVDELVEVVDEEVDEEVEVVEVDVLLVVDVVVTSKYPA